ncbi:MAG: hypothetical protein J6B10_01735 [Lachnospiraceae bacterium]|nr:hypothetical protein [Lachnospiraceae bacterium]
MLNIVKGTRFLEAGLPVRELYVLVSGSIQGRTGSFEMTLEKGDIIGLCDIAFDCHSVAYTALEDCMLAEYPYASIEDLTAILVEHPEYRHFFIISAAHLCHEILDHYVLTHFDCSGLYDSLLSKYEEYKELCTHFHISPKALPALETLEPLALEDDIPGWLSSYYEGIAGISSQKLLPFEEPSILTGFLMKLSQDLHMILDTCGVIDDYQKEVSCLLLSENRLDFFDLFTDLYYRAFRAGEDTLPLAASLGKQLIQIESSPYIDRSLYQERRSEYLERCRILEETPPEQLREAAQSKGTEALADSLEQILAYGKCDEELAGEFTECISRYKAMLDKNAADDEARKLRLRITKLFYQVYKNAFLQSVSDSRIPPVLMMFFHFGYVDEELAGTEYASYLYSIAGQYHGNETQGIYTMYEWLLAIYQGKKLPSRNEFDTDYEAHLRELRVSGKITAEEERRMADDNKQKVLYEMDNLFPIVNKTTFGRLSTFCPVFSEHNVLKDLESTLVTPAKAVDVINSIRSSDYSAFYRETVFTKPEMGISKEFVQVEILPDIILLPNLGTRGVMWQEIEGRRRTTPSRMLLSVFHLENLSNTLIRLTGEYRWEMCRRIQGARWNDLTDLSLTSEYFDYIQFYRKNHELSTDAKDKIKNSLQKAKNSYREMFVQDYLLWIQYEGNGSPRLNKVSRGILFTYCPFSAAIRTRLHENPLYKETLDRYDLHTAQKKHHLDMIFQKLNKSGTPVPEALEKQYQFLSS